MQVRKTRISNINKWRKIKKDTKRQYNLENCMKVYLWNKSFVEDCDTMKYINCNLSKRFPTFTQRDFRTVKTMARYFVINWILYDKHIITYLKEEKLKLNMMHESTGCK